MLPIIFFKQTDEDKSLLVMQACVCVFGRGGGCKHIYMHTHICSYTQTHWQEDLILKCFQKVRPSSPLESSPGFFNSVTFPSFSYTSPLPLVLTLAKMKPSCSTPPIRGASGFSFGPFLLPKAPGKEAPSLTLLL